MSTLSADYRRSTEEEFKEQDDEANESSTSLRQEVRAEVSIVPLQSSLDHQSKMQSLLPMGNLRFDRLGIVGRAKELTQLRDAIPSTKQETNSLVCLSGISGTGKTKLALSFRDPIQNNGGIFCQGKFESSNGAPYAGIAAAFNEACAILLQRGKQLGGRQVAAHIRKQLWKEIDAPQMELLLRLIPQLAILAHEPPAAKESSSNETEGLEKEDEEVLAIDKAIEREDKIKDEQTRFREVMKPDIEDPSSSTSIMMYEHSLSDVPEEQRSGSSREGAKQERSGSSREGAKDTSTSSNIQHLGPHVSSPVIAKKRMIPPKQENGMAITETILEEEQQRIPRRNRFAGFIRRHMKNSPMVDEAALAFALRQHHTSTRKGGILWHNNATSPGISNEPSTATHEPPVTPQASKELMERALLSLLRILVQEITGQMVWLLDDLQWVDPSSLDFLETLLTQQEYPITIITTHRSDHLEANTKEGHEGGDDGHPWKQTLDSLREKSSSILRLNEVSIGALTVAEVHKVICDLLSVAPEDAHSQTYELALLVHKRTLGNFYHVNVFLTTLVDQKFLTYNMGVFEWKWDINAIESSTSATDNVITLLHDKIEHFPSELKLLLQIAACLGHSFDVETIQLVWEDFWPKEQSDERKSFASSQVEKWLEIATRELFLELSSSSEDGLSASYRFVHHKVQEAAWELIPANNGTSTFQRQVGKILYRDLSEEKIDSTNLLFVVTDLLNYQSENAISDSESLESRIEMAELNLHAGQKAQTLAAFKTAGQFCEKGIALLMQEGSKKEQIWNEFPVLTLALFTTAAECQANTGNPKRSEELCTEVSSQKSLSILDKMRCLVLDLERLYSHNQEAKALELALHVLAQLGCSIQRNQMLQKLHAPGYMHETIKKHIVSLEEVDSMHFITDATRREAISLMIRAAGFAFTFNTQHNKPLYQILVCRCVRWTKLYGLTEHTASAFCSFANLLMHHEGDWEAGQLVGEIAVRIQDRFQNNHTKTTVLQKTLNMVYSWTRPLKSNRAEFLNAYQLGMLSGNIEGAAIAILCEMGSDFCSGSKLQTLDKDYQSHIPQFEKLGLSRYCLIMKMYHENILFLLDQKETVVLDFSVCPPFKLLFQHHYCVICAYMGDYSLGAQVGLEMGSAFHESFPGSFFGFEPMPRGLCLYAHARQSGDKKYAKAAAKAKTTLETWVDRGAINLVHQLLLLQAEDAAYQKDWSLAKGTYRKSIISAVRGGFLQNAALANERLAFCMKESGDDEECAYVMQEAIRLYREWGAVRKVNQLEQMGFVQ